MRLGIVFKPACRADVSRGCMPLPVECLYCSRAEGWYEVSFLSGEGASSASWSMASLCKNGLGWGLGCRHKTKVSHPCQFDVMYAEDDSTPSRVGFAINCGFSEQEAFLHRFIGVPTYSRTSKSTYQGTAVCSEAHHDKKEGQCTGRPITGLFTVLLSLLCPAVRSERPSDCRSAWPLVSLVQASWAALLPASLAR